MGEKINTKKMRKFEKERDGKTLQPVLPDRSPESALPYEADPVCEVVPPRAFWICRILKTSLGSGWLWTVTVSSSSCPISVCMVALVKCFAQLGTQIHQRIILVI